MPISDPPAAPDRKRQPTTRKTGPAVQATGDERIADRTDKLAQWAGIPSGFLMMRGFLADAAAVGAHARGIALGVVNLGESEEKIGKVVDKLIAVGPYAEIFQAVMPLLVQIGVNHGRVPLEFGISYGAVPPSVLEAKIRTEMAEVEAAAYAAQREAEERVAQIQAEMNGSHPTLTPVA